MSFYHYPEQPTSSYRTLDSNDYELVVRQQPKEALVTQHGKEKNRKPVDPPPIIELKVETSADPARQYLQSPYLFMQCTLQVEPGNENPQVASGHEITGQSVSSLHRLKDINNEDGGFFVFGDISVRLLGRHRLNFSLFELRKETGEVIFLKSTTSEFFDVVAQKQWRGLEESTHLSRTFSDQGVRLRLRKENRGMSGQKRNYPFASPRNTVQAGPSSAAVEQPGPSMYGGPPSLGGHYGAYTEIPPKRQRSDDYTQSQQAFAASERALPGYDTRTGASSIQTGYPIQPAPSRQSPQATYGMQTPVATTHWQQQFYGSASAPARVVNSDVRTAQGLTPNAPYALQPSAMGSEHGETYGRRGTEPYLLQQQTAQGSPTVPYQNANEAIYGHQASGSTTYIDTCESTAMARQHTQSAGSPTSSTRSAINPVAPVYPLQPSHLTQQNYSSLPDPSYHAYAQSAQTYRPQTYQGPPTPLLQQPLTNPHASLPLRPPQPSDQYTQQQPHPYSELGQGYHHPPGAGGYPTTQGQDKPWQ